MALALAPIDIASTHPEIELLLACARTALGGEAQQRIHRMLDTDLDWEYMLEVARMHCVTPLLYRTLHALCLDTVPAMVMQLLQQHYRASVQQSLFLTAELIKLVGAFEKSGVQALPLKGPALAILAYGDCALRRFGDLDILVHRQDVLVAKSVLLDLGYHPETAMTSRQEALHLQTHYVYTFIHTSSQQIVELHFRLRPRYFAFALTLEQLWERQIQVTVGARTVPSLRPEDLLLFLCVHGANHCWERLAWICDIAELLRAQPGLDWQAVLAQARASGSERMLLLGLSLAHDLLGAPLPHAIVERVRRDRVVHLLADQVHAQLFDTAEEPPGLFEVTLFHLRARERVRDRVRYCLGVATITTAEDWALVPLPASVSFLYSLIRPFRLFGTYGAGLLKYLPAREK